MDNAQFRLDFPEFGSTTIFTDAMLTFWAGIGAKVISQDRMGDLYNQALSLFVGHNITLQAGNIAAAGSGGTPGQASGAIASKAVGQVNVSYDTASAMEPNAGHWNQTLYGRQYIQLTRLLSKVAYQL